MQSLREQLISTRKVIDNHTKQQASKLITQTIVESDVFQHSYAIAFYKSVANEIDTQEMIEIAWKLGKQCYLPIVNIDNSLNFAIYNADSILKNQKNILEPESKNLINVQTLDLVFVPLIAFDRNCNRIGWGKGCYDRTFKFLRNNPGIKKPYLLGLAYEFQKQEQLDVQTWDVPLNAVVTELKVYKRKM